MRKIRYLLLLAVLLITTLPSFSVSALSSDTLVDLKVNGEFIKTDARPFLERGTTYVPIRFVSEALGADQVRWDGVHRTAIIEDGGKTIELTIGKSMGYVNEVAVKLDSTVKLVNDRTFVPVRFVAENLGAKVDWDYNNYIVLIEGGELAVPQSMIYKRPYTDEDLYWMSRIIEAESGGESMDGKVAVGNVVMNRVKSKLFPNTVYEVIFDTKFGIQFQPISNGAINKTPTHDSVVAAKYAMEGTKVVDDTCLFFLNPTISTSFWIMENREYSATIGNHAFYM